MNPWHLWQRGQEITKAAGFAPLLASWERKDYPAQVRLRSYLDQLMLDLGPIPSEQKTLCAHLTVDVKTPERLLHHYDLENYLTPLFGRDRLPPSRFRLVSAIKRIGGGSSLSIGQAMSMSSELEGVGWRHFSHATTGGTSTHQWKEGIKNALAETRPAVVAPGPVDVHLAWRCSTRRNWLNLWKPTGDVLGPVLGESPAGGEFNPNDDRIVALSMHLNTDDSVGLGVDVGVWWRAAD